MYIEVDLGRRWVGETRAEPSRQAGWAISLMDRAGQASIESGPQADSGFDSNPPYKKLCFTGETRILASQLSVSGILGLCIEVDPVVHEPCIPVTVWRVWRNVAPSPIILW